MVPRLYNSLDGEKQTLEPIEDNLVKIYICGQTVYDYMHVGHARTYIFFDILKRFLEFLGYTVETVINITDVNDKINERAESEDRSPWEVAEEFSKANLDDFEALGIEAEAYPRASEYMQEMIDLIEDLEKKGLAYEVDGDVFFDVRSFGDYGKLSNQDLADIESARDEEIISSEKKKNSEDFVLWRSREGSEFVPTWGSPWGEGVPGWHIECSSLSISLLGEKFDIHGGGSDLVFPHHEDEIAQTEAATGKKWVNYWMHVGLVEIGEEKMSKSLQNFVSARELLEKHDPGAIRLMMAETHYRKPMTYSPEKMEEAEKRVEKMKETLDNLEAEMRKAEKVHPKLEDDDLSFLKKILDIRAKLSKAMKDDMNTPQALKHLYELEKTSNNYLSNEPKEPVVRRARNVLLELGSIIGIFEREDEREIDLDSLVRNVLEIREELREEGNYELADSIRDSLESSGIKIEDTDRGPRWKK